MSASLQMIDLHHHARPDSFWKALAAMGVTIHGGRPFPPPTRSSDTVAMMDRVGISSAVLSAPDAEILFADLKFGKEQARNINESFAQTARDFPGRFGAFACLPMPHLDASLKEIEYALDTLKFDGVQLLTSYKGRYSGSNEFDPILEECNRRGAFVFVHPSTPIGMDLFNLDIKSFVLEFVNDTTRTIVNFIQNDIAARFPKCTFLFSHAGGNAPYLAARMALVDLFQNPKNELSIEEARAKWLKGLRSFYYDTALSAVDPVLGMMAEIVGADRIVFGSDFPQSKEPFVQATVDGVRYSKVLSAEQRYAVARGTALKLFPKFARAGDNVAKSAVAA